MKVSLYKILFLSLALMPLSPKIELLEGVKIFPQDLLLLPTAIILLFKTNWLKYPVCSSPYFYLLAGLTIMLLSTLYSLTKFADYIGLIKTLKYIFYVSLLILVSKYHLTNYLKVFNRVALTTILITLFLFLVDMFSFPGSLKEFLQASVWFNELIPTGLYNYVFSISQWKVVETGGTHGIYGGYLVLVLLVNYYLYRTKREDNRLSLALMILSIINILILTSRETLVLLVVLVLSLVVKDLLRLRLKKQLVYLIVGSVLITIVLIASNIRIGIIEKVYYTITSLSETGTEGNIQVRFTLWKTLFYSYWIHPWNLLTGIGYNITSLQHLLTEASDNFGLNMNPLSGSTTESFFLMFLVYGGSIAFFFALSFWLDLFLKLKSRIKKSLIHYLFFFITIGLFINNNTGGNMLSDMFMIQYGLTFFWLVKTDMQV